MRRSIDQRWTTTLDDEEANYPCIRCNTRPLFMNLDVRSIAPTPSHPALADAPLHLGRAGPPGLRAGVATRLPVDWLSETRPICKNTLHCYESSWISKRAPRCTSEILVPTIFATSPTKRSTSTRRKKASAPDHLQKATIDYAAFDSALQPFPAHPSTCCASYRPPRQLKGQHFATIN